MWFPFFVYEIFFVSLQYDLFCQTVFMGKDIFHIIYIVIAILAVGCTGVGDGKNGHEPLANDTLYTEAAAMAAHATQPGSERALLIIDSAEIVGNLQPYDAQFLRARVYCQSYDDMRLDSAIIICEQLMEEDSVKMNDIRAEEVLEVLVNACRQKRDDEGEFRWVTQLVNHCYKQGWVTEALRNEAEVGVILTHLGNIDEGLAKIDSVIVRLDGIRKFNELDACIIAMKRKICVLKEIGGKSSEIITVAQRILDMLADYEQHPNYYHDGTYREPPDEHRSGYIDFYRSQAWSYLAYAYALKNNHRQARHYLDLFLQSYYGQTLDGRESSAAIYALLGDYDRMLAIHDEWEHDMDGDTVNAYYATILRDRATAVRAKGRVTEAYNLMCRHDALEQQLSDRLLRSKAHLYAARFRAQEQQREIDRQHARMRHAQIICMSIAIGALLILLFALYALRQWRKTQRHNRILAQQITEASHYKDEFRKLNYENRTTTELKFKMQNSELGNELCDLIEREQLFLNHNFDRQMLMDRTGLSKEQIGAAFSPSRFPTFVRELRLDHAVRLMNEHPDLTIEQICLNSGFANADTFTRNFRSKYGMTPTAYIRLKS